jgi:hypothetical protein
MSIIKEINQKPKLEVVGMFNKLMIKFDKYLHMKLSCTL